MGNFEKLSVLVIVVIIVMILVVALYTWTDNPDAATKDAATPVASSAAPKDLQRVIIPTPPQPPLPASMGDDKFLPGAGVPSSPYAIVPQVSPAVIAPPEPVKAEPKIHEVVSGDTLGRIAKKYGTTVSAIEQANPGVEPTSLRVGAKLTVPEKAAVAKADPKADPAAGKEAVAPLAKEVASVRPGTIYTFKKGDTLPGLSKRAYGTADRWHEIWIANYSAIDNPDVVPPGTRVKLPAK